MATKRGTGVPRKDGMPRESNMGTRKPVVDDSNWRVKAQRKHRIKFDDKAKERFLKALRKTGRRWAAEVAARVARSTVDAHLKNDPEFAEAYEEAAEAYTTRGIVKIEKEALEGHQELTYDAEGNVIKERRVFETRLREMFLKRNDPAYKDKSEVELNARGGCVLIPGTAALADWEKAVSEHDRSQAKNHNPDAHTESEGE